ncbi:DUF1064 domain-containing protein [Vibrio splendidus]
MDSISLKEFRDDPLLSSSARLGNGKRNHVSQNSQSKPSKKRSKYGAQRVCIDGIWFDSRLEGARYVELKLESRQGHIVNLRLQKSYELKVNDVLVSRYIADFVYMRDGIEVVEDTKGHKTPEYKIKKSLMKAIYDIDIFETTRDTIRRR